MGTDEQTLLLFRVAGIACAVPALQSDGIVLPPSPHASAGLFQQDGQVTVLVELREKFGASDATSKGGRLLLWRYRDSRYGFRVDEVLGLTSDGKPAPLPPDVPRSVFTGAFLYQNELVLITDFTRLLAMRPTGALLARQRGASVSSEGDTVAAAPRSEARRPVEADRGQPTTLPRASTVQPPRAHPQPQEKEAAPAPPTTRPAPTRPSTPRSPALPQSPKPAPATLAPPSATARAKPVANRPSVAPLRNDAPTSGSRVPNEPSNEPHKEVAWEAPPSGATSGDDSGRFGAAPIVVLVLGAVAAFAAYFIVLSPEQPTRRPAIRTVHSAAPAPVPADPLPAHAPMALSAPEAVPALIPEPEPVALTPIPVAEASRQSVSVERVANEVAVIFNRPEPATPAAAPVEEPAPPPVKEELFVHTVVRGDTLWHIAERYVNDPWRFPELAAQSGLHNPDLIYPGDRVRIILR